MKSAKKSEMALEETPGKIGPGSVKDDLDLSGAMESLSNSVLESVKDRTKAEEPLAIKKQTTSQEDELRKMASLRKKESDIQAMQIQMTGDSFAGITNVKTLRDSLINHTIKRRMTLHS